MATAAGQPGRGGSVPSGTSRTNAPPARGRRRRRGPRPATTWWAPSPPSTSAAPATSTTALRRRSSGRGRRPAARRRPRRRPPATVGQHRQRHGRGQRHERQQGEEHHAPGRGVLDGAGRGRADQPGDDPGAGEHREHPGPQVRRVRPGDGGVGDGGDHAGAEALQHPAGHEHGHRRRRPADDQPDGEQRQPGGERQAGAPPVGGPAGEHDAEQAAEEEPAEHPAVQAEAAEVVGHHRHHRGDGERLERHQRDRQHQGGGEPPPTRRPDAVLGAGARRLAAVAGGAVQRGRARGSARPARLGVGGHGRHRGRSTSC